MIKALAALVVLLLGLTACSSGLSNDQAVSILSRDLVSEAGSTVGFTITKTQADCVAHGLVDTFGTSKLISLGLLTTNAQTAATSQIANLPSPAAKSVVEIFGSCIDVLALVRAETEADSAFQKLPTKVKKCVRKVLDDSVARGLLQDSFDGGTVGQTQLQTKVSACVGK